MDQTEQDRSNEQEVADHIFKHVVGRFPFVGHKMKFEAKRQTGSQHDHDFDVWYSGYRVGIIEMKCREDQYSRKFLERNNYMISRDKLEYLWKQNDLGFKAMLAVRTSDGYVFTAMIEDLVAGKDKWTTPTPEMMSTTNHGKDKRKNPEKGFILPMDLFYNIGQLERFE
jgi:hypothetical protein